MNLRTSNRVFLAFVFLTSFALATHSQTIPTGIPVLAYHRFDPTTPAATTVTTATFESQLAFLAEHHYTIVPLERVVEAVLRKTPPPRTLTLAITVDDGHRSVYTVLFPLIKQHHIPVTLFIYPSAISHAPYALTWDQLKEMHASGLVDIQSHTYWHPDFRHDKAHRTPSDYTAFVHSQLTKSRLKLDAELGTHITLLAWPYGILDADLEAASAQDGYVAAFGYSGGVARAGDDPYSIHRIPVPNFAHGFAFEALLRDAQARPEGNSSHAGHE
ncbi:polysaccharide deacetylase family protein [Terriglobus saanensis]|uniref:polysaccharide deacetylase family protein n=1 Tax=Terriglobus saanensis TaxID=870903 RepID=UPI0002EEF056|nr:polysaccharide deacetylase family protein [Terriglobus saanensis]